MMEMDSLARSPNRAKLKICLAPRTRKYPPTWPAVAGMSSSSSLDDLEQIIQSVIDYQKVLLEATTDRTA